MKRTIANCAAELSPETVAEVFKFYSDPNKTLNDTLHKYRQFSEHTLRAMLKRESVFEQQQYDSLYDKVRAHHLTAVQSKFFRKVNSAGQRKKVSAEDAFEARNKILTAAFRAKLAYDHSLAECRRAGLDDQTVEAFFSLVGEGDFNAS